MKLCHFETFYGKAAVIWNTHGVKQILLPSVPRARVRAVAGNDAEVVDIEDAPYALQIRAYLNGEASSVAFPIDRSGFTPFQRAVYTSVRKIPRGQVRSYGQVALSMGRPGAARGVGQAMANNPVPLFVPCHRVLGAGGQMVGFSAPGGIPLKRKLLAMEQRMSDSKELERSRV